MHGEYPGRTIHLMLQQGWQAWTRNILGGASPSEQVYCFIIILFLLVAGKIVKFVSYLGVLKVKETHARLLLAGPNCFADDIPNFQPL